MSEMHAQLLHICGNYYFSAKLRTCCSLGDVAIEVVDFSKGGVEEEVCAPISSILRQSTLIL